MFNVLHTLYFAATRKTLRKLFLYKAINVTFAVLNKQRMPIVNQVQEISRLLDQESYMHPMRVEESQISPLSSCVHR